MVDIITPQSPKCPFMAQLAPIRGLVNQAQVVVPDCMKAQCALWAWSDRDSKGRPINGYCGLGKRPESCEPI